MLRTIDGEELGERSAVGVGADSGAGVAGTGTGTGGGVGAAGTATGVGAGGEAAQKSAMAATFVPLLIDVAVPVGGYYLLHNGFGVGLVMSLALSGVVPAVRTVVGAVRDRAFNRLAGLMLAVNVIGIALSFLTGDPRLMIAKDSGISSVIDISILISVVRGNPMMSAGLKPVLTKGRAERVAAWDRLSAEDDGFRRLERVFSAVWGGVLLADCVARVIGAYTLPIHTMMWMGTVLLVGSIGLGIVLGGWLASDRMDKMITAAA